VKGNHGALHDLVAEWLHVAGVNERAPDHVQVDKGHGRVERREVWAVPAGELGAYLQADYDWPSVQWMGQIQRYRRFLRQTEWESVKTTLWIAGGKNLPPLSPEQIQQLLRRHWVIENGVFHVRDVTYSEDRLHGRRIGLPLSVLRNSAINLIRHAGFQYVIDARRYLPSLTDIGLSWLFHIPSLENR
jgi:hypothetical protein